MKKSWRDKSTISLEESIVWHVIWSAALFWIYYHLLFLPIGKLSKGVSFFILFLCVMLCIFVGQALTNKKCLSLSIMVVDVFGGYGLYSMLAYGKKYRVLIVTIILCSLVISYVNARRINNMRYRGKFVYEIEDGKKREKVRYLRKIKALKSTIIIFGISFIGFMVVIVRDKVVIANYLNSNLLYSYPVMDSDFKIDDSASLKNNIEVIGEIRSDETWMRLSLQDKMLVYEAVIRCEERYLGLTYPISLVMDDLEGNTIGLYNDIKRSISVDREFLEDSTAEEALELICHEMYHAYQNRLTELYCKVDDDERQLYIFRKCPTYIDELLHYTSGNGSVFDMYKYYTQEMEKDSRVYAKGAVMDYYEEIDLILEEQKQGNYYETVASETSANDVTE